MGILFGTDGVRGVANSELTCELAFKLGQAGAYVLTGETHHRPRILVGRDTRISGNMLEAALVAGICSVGAEAALVGVLPTPAVAYLTRAYEADAGVMISASHNPVEDNGIKFFNSQGYKLADAIEDAIEDIILNNRKELPQPIGAEVGASVQMRNARRDYIRFLQSTMGTSLEGLFIVLDCANGAASRVAPEVFQSMGAKVCAFYNDPDGTNINDNCGSTHPKHLQQRVVELGADVGLAFDGDADRLIAVDGRGVIVDGDQIMAICAGEMRRHGTLKKDTLVATVMSNMGLDLAMQREGVKIEKTGVGDRYVLEKMLAEGYNLGGEQSGHIIFTDFNTTGDGMVSALQLTGIMARTGKPLCELADIMQVLPQVLVGAKVSNERKDYFAKEAAIAQRIALLDRKYAGRGRVLVRASGTEPLVRVMIEGEDLDEMQRDAQGLAQLIEQQLKVCPE